MHRYQQPIDHAIERVEDPLPSDGAQRHRRDPRQHHQESHYAAASELISEGQGKREGANDDQNLRADGEDHGVEQGPPERRAVQHAAKILQPDKVVARSEEHTSELQSLAYLVCRLLLEKKKKKTMHVDTSVTAL